MSPVSYTIKEMNQNDEHIRLRQSVMKKHHPVLRYEALMQWTLKITGIWQSSKIPIVHYDAKRATRTVLRNNEAPLELHSSIINVVDVFT